MLSFGDDLARLAGEFVSGHELRTGAISSIRMQVRENRSTHDGNRATAREKSRESTAAAAAARSDDLNQRSASVQEMREANQACIRDDMAKLRQDLAAARGDLAATVETLRETMGTEHAKMAADLRKQLGEDLAKLRGDMQRQFAAARAAWPRDGEARRTSMAPRAPAGRSARTMAPVDMVDVGAKEPATD